MSDWISQSIGRRAGQSALAALALAPAAAAAAEAAAAVAAATSAAAAAAAIQVMDQHREQQELQVDDLVIYDCTETQYILALLRAPCEG